MGSIRNTISYYTTFYVDSLIISKNFGYNCQTTPNIYSTQFTSKLR